MLRSYMAHLVATGLTRRLHFFVTLPVLASADDARWLRDSLPHHRIPDNVIERLESAKDPELEGVLICAEQLRELNEIPGVQGAHLLATRNLAPINAAVEAAGLVDGPPA
jgi:methylenetetrahydrofolate reductase (NADPH)